jgi:hypothetical protein
MSGTSRPNPKNELVQGRGLHTSIPDAIKTNHQTKARTHHGTREKVQIDAAYPRHRALIIRAKLTGRYSRTLDRTDLLGLIRGGEDTHLEFKIRLVNTDKVVAEIVALANAGGGAIIFGVNDQRRVEGLDNPEQVEEQLIDICRNQIKPPLFPRIDKVSFDNGTRIVVLQVDDRRSPHQTPDHRYFIRIGSTKRGPTATR